jgi:UDP-N-acetylmuramyl tripeptide synthase
MLPLAASARLLLHDMRRGVAIASGRATERLSRRFGHHGTSLPGLVAERLDPAILAELRGNLGQVVVVLGTNGKTTTTRLIAQIVGSTSSAPISNRSGANLRQGLITAMIADRRRQPEGGRPAVLEVDEMTFGSVVGALRPDVVVVLNLLRDQLDRYGELDVIEDRWVRDLGRLPPESVIIMCGDDPRLESVARRVAEARPVGAEITRFGLDYRKPRVRDEEAGVDPDRGGLGTPGVAHCPKCAGGLVYDGRPSAGLGVWACPACGAHRQRLDLGVAVDGVDHAGWLRLTFFRPGRRDADSAGSVRVRLTGTAGAYDAAAAVLAATALGVPWERAISALDGATPAFGRMEEIEIGDRTVILTLAKNPASMAQAVDAAAARHPDALVIALGDRPADGRDVSWIWDAELDRLPVCPLTLTGSRADDLELRFKYSPEDEVPPRDERAIVVDPTVEHAVDRALDRLGPGGTLMILATYTVLLRARTALRRRVAAFAATA